MTFTALKVKSKITIRSVLVNASELVKHFPLQNLYLNKYEWNKKTNLIIIVVMWFLRFLYHSCNFEHPYLSHFSRYRRKKDTSLDSKSDSLHFLSWAVLCKSDGSGATSVFSVRGTFNWRLGGDHETESWDPGGYRKSILL